MSIIKPENNKSSFVQSFVSQIFHTGRMVANVQNFGDRLKNGKKHKTESVMPNHYQLPNLAEYANEQCHIFVPANAENHSYYAITRFKWATVPKAATLILPESYHNPKVRFNLNQYSSRVAASIVEAIENPKIKSIYLNAFSIGGATLLHALADVISRYDDKKDMLNKIKKIDVRNTFSNIRDVLRFSALKLLFSSIIILVLSLLDVIWFRSKNALVAFAGIVLTALLLPISVVIKLSAEIISWTIGWFFPSAPKSLFCLAAYLSSPFVDAILARCGDSGFDAQQSLRVVAKTFSKNVKVIQTLNDRVVGARSRLINEKMIAELQDKIEIEISPKGGHVAHRASQYQQYNFEAPA